MGQGYEDHLVTQEADIPEVDRVQWRKIDAQLFLDCDALTPDVGAQQTQLDKFFMVLTLIGLRPDLEPIRDQILGSSSVPSLDDVFARLLRISSTQTLPSDSASDSSVLVSQTTSRGGRSGTRGRGQRPHCTYCNKLGHTRDRCYQLHGRPPRTAHMAQSSDSPLPQPPSSSASQTSQAFYCLCCPAWIFSPLLLLPLIYLLLPLANGSQLWLKDRSTGKTIGIGRESQASITSPQIHLLQFAFPLMLLSSFTIVWATLVSPSSRRCDNAREYFSAQFTSFMSHHGILHQSSCAHTRQQNGVAERKNRHLVETARTLLLHSHVPFRFWGDAVLTACYLINHKLSAKAMKCLFLGYSRLQKGYRCYSLKTHRYFISADVTFFEDSPFFSTTSESLPVSEVLPIPIVSPPDAMPPRPLQVYHRRPRVVAPLPFPEAPADSLPIPSASPAPALLSPNDLPIAVRKGTRSTRNPHPIYNFLSYHRLSSPYSAFVSAISSVSLPKSTQETLSNPGWRQAMVDEMTALHSNGTWDLVVLPSGKSTVGCRWVYAVKVGPDGQVDRLKARLVAKGYTQVYGSDYGDTFSPVAKIASVRLLLSMATMCSWPLYQLDIKKCLPSWRSCRGSLYGATSWFCCSGGVWFSVQVTPFSIWLETISSSMCIYLVVYVDDIVITGSDQDAQSSSGVVLSQRKYALDILEETGMLDCKPVDTPMDPNVKLVTRTGGAFRRPREISTARSHWDAVIRILRYIKSTPGQGVLYENRGHTQVVGYTDADWAGSPTDRRSTSGYCVFIGGNLISWKSKKQDVVARSSAEAEYRAMALATCELIWLRHLLQELRFGKDEQMKLICDNQAALHIASNPVFHERTKHIEVDCHFIREKIASGCVATSFVNSNDQLADIFTKSLRGPRIKYICNKLGAYDVYAPA
ncbi:Retrovirus-related Pol polyprotein from transposon TNT 1-94 [Vitis vinifera]|uniref:Retrovirus-related Pol polyprotein from transposon TNT 1-94 n=1 Tax=Vitis vinifera TaxID=29760 RepID=A0A438DW24_VITVI|nr:Retrovirus-related Pol polyprotein from transposon TNT 1-94 [Vitis vinifera]